MASKLLLTLAAAALTSAGSAAVTPRMITLNVTRMDCAVCPITVRKALERVPGVESARVDFRTARAVVVFDPVRTSIDTLTRATADAGFPSSVSQAR